MKKFLSLFTIVQFPNLKCQANSTTGSLYEGICYHKEECDRLNGTALGDCANGFGVCCIFRFTCGSSTNQNCSYFENPNYPNFDPPNSGIIVPTTTTITPTTSSSGQTPDPRFPEIYYNKPRQLDNENLFCLFEIYKINSNIRQFRIDFIDLELTSPINGNCTDERLVIFGDNIRGVPIICGYNTGQHIYVDVSSLTGPLQIAILSTIVRQKRFKLRICQINSNCTNTNNCLQYYTGNMGMISSFNYEQAAMYNRSVPGYFNNLNYAICIRREIGYCSITYTNTANSITFPFQLRNVINGQNIVPSGQAGAEIFNCPNDYILLNGIRLCGDRFNDGSLFEDFTQNAPVTDNNAGPIVVIFKSDSTITGRGFKLFFMQNPCT